MKNLLNWILNLDYNVAVVEFAGEKQWYLVFEMDFPNPNGAMPNNFVFLRGVMITEFIQNNIHAESKTVFEQKFKQFVENIQQKDFVQVKFSNLIPYMFWAK